MNSGIYVIVANMKELKEKLQRQKNWVVKGLYS